MVGVLDQEGRVVCIKIVFFFPALVDHGLREDTAEFHDVLKLLLLIVSREDGFAGVKLCKDAPKRPDVDPLGVRDSQDDFGSAVKAGLDVSVDLLVTEATGAKVDHLERVAAGISYQDILGLQVTMDDLSFFEEYKSLQKLVAETLNFLLGKAFEVVVFQMLEQVSMEQFKNETLVVPKSDVFLHSDDVVFIIGVFSHQELEQAGLLLGELMIDLSVAVNLDCYLVPGHVVKA